MKPSDLIPLILFSAFFYVSGALLLFRTKYFVEKARRRYEKSGVLLKIAPQSRIVLKPWYPLFLRCAGVFIWLWALMVDCFVLFYHASGT